MSFQPHHHYLIRKQTENSFLCILLFFQPIAWVLTSKFQCCSMEHSIIMEMFCISAQDSVQEVSCLSLCYKPPWKTASQHQIHYCFICNLPFLLGCVFLPILIHWAGRSGKVSGNFPTEEVVIGEGWEQRRGVSLQRKVPEADGALWQRFRSVKHQEDIQEATVTDSSCLRKTYREHDKKIYIKYGTID